MAAARPHSTQHEPPGALALAAKPLALTPSAPWRVPIAWALLGAGIASLALVSFPPGPCPADRQPGQGHRAGGPEPGAGGSGWGLRLLAERHPQLQP